VVALTGADRAIRYSTIGAVSVVALVAAFVSYRHALQVVRAHGETGPLALAYPVTVDGLIYAASMVLLNAARQGIRPHWLAYVALGLGIAATLAANVAAGLSYGPVGALVASWPAPALVISYELLMIVAPHLGAGRRDRTRSGYRRTRATRRPQRSRPCGGRAVSGRAGPGPGTRGTAYPP
jgi:hypothetical protein